MKAAKPDFANDMYEQFNELVREQDVDVETGVFQEYMQVSLMNDGPVTLILDSNE